MGHLMKKLGNHSARVLKGKPKLKLQRHNSIENVSTYKKPTAIYKKKKKKKKFDKPNERYSIPSKVKHHLVIFHFQAMIYLHLKQNLN